MTRGTVFNIRLFYAASGEMNLANLSCDKVMTDATLGHAIFSTVMLHK